MLYLSYLLREKMGLKDKKKTKKNKELSQINLEPVEKGS